MPDSDDTIEGHMSELMHHPTMLSTTTPSVTTPASAEDEHTPNTDHHTDDPKES